MTRRAPHAAAAADPADPGKREAILAAALDLFAERGFDGTAVPLVAERAGVGAGTLYRYFDSKEALVNAVFRRWKSELATALLTDFPAEAAPREQFHQYWQRIGRFAIDHPAAFTFLELHHHRPYLDAESRALEEMLLTTAQSLVERAQAQQAMKRLPPPLLMALVYGAFVGLWRGSREGYLELTPKTLKDSEHVLWEAIRL